MALQQAIYNTGSQLVGTTTNDNAAAGNVGEEITSNIILGSAVSLSSTVSANLTSISLTAGDWEVEILPIFTGTTTAAQLLSGIGTTTGTISLSGGNFASVYPNQGTAFSAFLPGCPLKKRVSLSATTTVFGVVQSTFGVGTNTAYGLLRARRIR